MGEISEADGCRTLAQARRTYSVNHQLEENLYSFVPGLISPRFAQYLFKTFYLHMVRKDVNSCNQVKGAIATCGSPALDGLLLSLRPTIERLSERELYPTYSFGRLYRKGDELLIHCDRPACEISVSLALECVAGKNILYVAQDALREAVSAGDALDLRTLQKQSGHDGLKERATNASGIEMNVGDAVIYKGCECLHWRDPFDGHLLAQVFLHYVDKNGPHASSKYDGREAEIMGENSFYMASEEAAHEGDGIFL
jgi:hypothetical protein